MNSELEETATLDDVGPILVIQYADGGRGFLKLRSVDNVATLKLIAPLIVDVIEPSELCERLMAPLTMEDSSLTETVTPDALAGYLEEDRAAAEAADAEAKRERAAALAHTELMARLEAEQTKMAPIIRERRRIADLIFSSPSRRAADRAKAQQLRVMQGHCYSLQLQCEVDAKEAATVAAEAVRAEFAARRQRIEKAFHAGKEWRNI